MTDIDTDTDTDIEFPEPPDVEEWIEAGGVEGEDPLTGQIEAKRDDEIAEQLEEKLAKLKE